MRFVQRAHHVQDALLGMMRRRVHENQETHRAQRVSGVESLRYSVHGPERAPAMPQFVPVFDVVMDERIVVENLDRSGRIERAFYPR